LPLSIVELHQAAHRIVVEAVTQGPGARLPGLQVPAVGAECVHLLAVERGDGELAVRQTGHRRCHPADPHRGRMPGPEDATVVLPHAAVENVQAAVRGEADADWKAQHRLLCRPAIARETAQVLLFVRRTGLAGNGADDAVRADLANAVVAGI